LAYIGHHGARPERGRAPERRAAIVGLIAHLGRATRQLAGAAATAKVRLALVVLPAAHTDGSSRVADPAAHRLLLDARVAGALVVAQAAAAGLRRSAERVVALREELVAERAVGARQRDEARIGGGSIEPCRGDRAEELQREQLAPDVFVTEDLDELREDQLVGAAQRFGAGELTYDLDEALGRERHFCVDVGVDTRVGRRVEDRGAFRSSIPVTAYDARRCPSRRLLPQS